VKRWAFRLGFFLLLGAIINVAVAWIAGETAVLPRGMPNDALASDQATMLWQRYGTGIVPPYPAYAPKGWRERRVLTTTTWFGTSLMAKDGRFKGIAVTTELCDVLIVESGAPFRTLGHVDTNVAATMMGGLAAPAGRRRSVTDHVLWLSHATFLWPGFAINTIFYAGILWVLFAIPGRVRRWRRIKRGLCPACAYPVGDSAVCTECGKQVKA
jgi:hypothetical protein